MLLKGMKQDDKKVEYIQSSLRSAKDIYMYGGHVTKTYRDQVFRLVFDNRRLITVPKDIDPNNTDFSSMLLDSSPLQTAEQCAILRGVGKLHHKKPYNKMSSTLTGNKYKRYSDLAVRNFIKGLLSNPVLYNLGGLEFKDYASIIEFVKGYDGGVKISKQSISNLKNRQMVIKSVPRLPETEAFVKYVKDRYPAFNETEFFKI